MSCHTAEFSVFQLLLENESEIEAVNQWCETAMFNCVRYGGPEVTQVGHSSWVPLLSLHFDTSERTKLRFWCC